MYVPNGSRDDGTQIFIWRRFCLVIALHMVIVRMWAGELVNSKLVKYQYRAALMGIKNESIYHYYYIFTACLTMFYRHVWWSLYSNNAEATCLDYKFH